MLRPHKTLFEIAGLAALWLLVAARPAAAQLQTGFELGDGYTGSDVGTVLTGQNGWYLPPNTASSDFSVFTYAGNALGLPPNPSGASQLIAAQGLGDGTFPRAQMDFDWSTQTRWTVEYDIAAHFNGTLPAQNNLSSFSLQPGPDSFLALNTWADMAGATTWNAGYNVYDASGGPAGGTLLSAGDAWKNLTVDNWYHQSITFDLSTNQIISVSITDLTTGTTATASPNAWYLSANAPQPLALRFFVGGGQGMFPGNVMGFDNLSITPAPGGN